MSRFLRFLSCGLLLLDCAVAAAQAVPDMLERVLPAVVTVAVREREALMTPFGFAGEGEPSAADAAYRRVLDLSGVESSGSGFVILYGGEKYVVTNAHVVQNAAGAGALRAYSISQREYPMRLVGADSFYDLAVLAFEGGAPGSEVGVVQFRADEPRVGEQVFAIGNPLGDYPYSVTDGIVSGKNRFLAEGVTAKYGYLQSSATTIWGNSGGPLVDVAGRVAGVNTQIGIERRGGQAFIQPQLNFALEARIAQRLVEDFFTNNGRVRRAFLGVEIVQRYALREVRGPDGEVHTVPADLLDGLPVIAAAMPNTPAASALGRYTGAQVTRINGTQVRNVEEALGALEQVRPGGEVTFEFTQNGERATARVRAGELTLERLGEQAAFAFGRYGAAELVQGNGEVRLRYAGGGKAQRAPVRKGGPGSLLDRLDFDRGSKRFKRAEEQAWGQPEVAVVAAGTVGEGGPSLWRVRSASDLGIAVRLSAISGMVVYVPQQGGGEAVERLWLSEDRRVLSRTLLY